MRTHTNPNNHETTTHTHTLHVDPESLIRVAHQGVPTGEYHVDAEALRQARQGVPTGEYHVDAEAFRRARQGVPLAKHHRLKAPNGNHGPQTALPEGVLSMAGASVAGDMATVMLSPLLGPFAIPFILVAIVGGFLGGGKLGRGINNCH